MALVVVKPGSLVFMVGAPGSGKSTFAKANFKEDEILSSDAIREWISGDANNQSCSQVAFTILHMVANQRMRYNQTVVIDATNTKQSDRSPYLADAFTYNRKVFAFVFDVPIAECIRRDAIRERTVGEEVIRKFYDRLPQAMIDLKEEVDELHIVKPGEPITILSMTLEELNVEARERGLIK